MTAPTRPRSVPPIRPAGTAPAVQWRQARRDLATVNRQSQVCPALGRVVAAIAKRREAV